MENNIEFLTTGFKGFEDDVLELFNLNRPVPATKKDLEWRYLGEKSPVDPIIFWVVDNNGKKVGMSSLILRAYWINGEKYFIPVRADTSVNKSLRGKGVGKKLLMEQKRYLEKSDFPVGFALSTPLTLHVGKAAGWLSDDLVIPYVMGIEPSNKIEEKLKNKTLSKIIGKIYYLFYLLKIKINNDSQIAIKKADEFDEAFDIFWNGYNKKGKFTRDRNRKILEWRYLKHPTLKYEICKIFYNEKMIGYLIYNMEQAGWMVVCSIYDFVITETNLVKPAILQFSRYIKDNYPRLSSIRIHLNEKNEYNFMLKKTGFHKRQATGAVVKYIKSGINIPGPECWNINLGDKDI